MSAIAERIRLVVRWVVVLVNTALAVFAPVGLFLALGSLDAGNSVAAFAILLGLLLVVGYWRRVLRSEASLIRIRLFWLGSAAYNGVAFAYAASHPAATPHLIWTAFMMLVSVMEALWARGEGASAGPYNSPLQRTAAGASSLES